MLCYEGTEWLFRNMKYVDDNNDVRNIDVATEIATKRSELKTTVHVQ